MPKASAICHECSRGIYGDRRSSEAQKFKPILKCYMDAKNLPVPLNVWFHEKCRRRIRNFVNMLNVANNHLGENNALPNSPGPADEMPNPEPMVQVSNPEAMDEIPEPENVEDFPESEFMDEVGNPEPLPATHGPEPVERSRPVPPSQAQDQRCRRTSPAHNQMRLPSDPQYHSQQLEHHNLEAGHSMDFEMGEENVVSPQPITDARQNVVTEYSQSTMQDQSHGIPDRQVVKLKTFSSIPYSEKKCCICPTIRGEPTRRGYRVKPTAVLDLLLTTNIIMPSKNRCCPEHIDKGVFCETAKLELLVKCRDYALLKLSEIDPLLQKLVTAAKEGRQKPEIDLSGKNYTDDDYFQLFGITKVQFAELLEYIKGHLKSTCSRSAENALGMLLIKLRLGISQEMISFLFGVSQRTVSSAITGVAVLLDKFFVSKNLGYGHISREDILQHHSSEFVRNLYGVHERNITLFADGTYLYVDKSGDHDLQRKTYSMQKGRNLLKPMMIVLPDGYILAVGGLYYADNNHNDAAILRDMLEEAGELPSFLHLGDNFVVDRGFLYVRDYLEMRCISVRMPAFLAKGQNQLPAKEANDSRMVTFTRWIVEAVNGRIKNTWKFFDQRIPSHYFNRNCNQKLGRLFRIGCAILNRFKPPLFYDCPKHDIILREVHRRYSTTNSLKDELVQSGLLTRTVPYQKLAADDLLDFPLLTLDDLELITLGEYQLRNARAYVERQLRLDPHFALELHRDRPETNLVRVRLRSRFTSSTTHLSWIEYGSTGDEDKIKRWYCKCKAGARTLGCCSHIAAILWFLGYERWQNPGMAPREFGTGILEIVRQRFQQHGCPDSDDDADEGEDSAEFSQQSLQVSDVQRVLENIDVSQAMQDLSQLVANYFESEEVLEQSRQGTENVDMTAAPDSQVLGPAQPELALRRSARIRTQRRQN